MTTDTGTGSTTGMPLELAADFAAGPAAGLATGPATGSAAASGADAASEPEARDGGRALLRLYIAGTSPRSARTIESVRRVCDAHLGAGYDLEVVDLYQQPGLAAGDRVVAAPTLVRLAPGPCRRIAGDLSDERRLLHGLGLGRETGDTGEPDGL